MLGITVVAVGGLSELYWKQAVAEYQKRLRPHCKLEIRECREARLPQKPSAAEIEKAVNAEGASILRLIPDRAHVFALCIEAGQRSSPDFSRELERLTATHSQIAFVIGGSHGLSGAVKKRANTRFSLSEMTFPHQLARVMLLEQLYRAFAISGGSPYHK